MSTSLLWMRKKIDTKNPGHCFSAKHQLHLSHRELKVLDIHYQCVCERFYISESGCISFFRREKTINSAILLLTSRTNTETKKMMLITFLYYDICLTP